jgi:hypothetical protein
MRATDFGDALINPAMWLARRRHYRLMGLWLHVAQPVVLGAYRIYTGYRGRRP